MTPIQKISLNATRIELFARNPDHAKKNFLWLERFESKSTLLDQFRFSVQIRKLNSDIQEYIRQGHFRSLTNRAEPFKRECNHFSKMLDDPITYLGLLSDRLKIILNLAQITDLGLPRRAPQPPEAPPPAPVPMEEVPDFLLQEFVVDRTAKMAEKIIHTRFDDLQAADGIFDLLMSSHYYKSWQNAFDTSDGEIFERFPAIIEGRKKFSIGYLVQNLSPEKSLSKEMRELVKKGYQNRNENQHFVYLVTQRKSQINHLIHVNLKTCDLINEIRLAMKAEYLPFISRVPTEKIPNEVLNDLIIWLASRGCETILSQILKQRRNEIALSAFSKAFELVHKYKHEKTFKTLYNSYPHNRAAAPNVLLYTFATHGIKMGLIQVLFTKYAARTTDQMKIEAFKLCLENHRSDCLLCFLDTKISQKIADGIDSEICYSFARRLIHFSATENEKFVILKTFIESPFYKKISVPHFIALAKETAQLLAAKHIKLWVDHKPENTHPLYVQQILLAPGKFGQWDKLLDLADLLDKATFLQIRNSILIHFSQTIPLDIVEELLDMSETPAAILNDYPIRTAAEGNFRLLKMLYERDVMAPNVSIDAYHAAVEARKFDISAYIWNESHRKAEERIPGLLPPETHLDELLHQMSKYSRSNSSPS